MLVIFVSQCEKNAIKKTNRILDSFASRIGDRTWETIITSDGLLAVKKLLRKTASKNTAVSCHWIRGVHKTELLWIVGNRNKFNENGIVPIGTTKKDISHLDWENDWHFLDAIKAITAIAALLHDLGKASKAFQRMLNSTKKITDVIRHEWISFMLFYQFININNCKDSDTAWLDLLITSDIESLIKMLKKIVKVPADIKETHFNNLPNLAAMISWLVLSHHVLPAPQDPNSWRNSKLTNIQDLFLSINYEWGYKKYKDNEDYTDCYVFNKGLPITRDWAQQLQKWANKLKSNLSTIEQSFNDGSWRIIINFCRLSLMLGDYNYSSQPLTNHELVEKELYANSDHNSGKLKQTLENHLLGVEKVSLRVAHLLPNFEKSLPRAYDIKRLKISSSMNSPYYWQDKAVRSIDKWQGSLDSRYSNAEKTGFFGINLASTGCGKTHANAKIMKSLSVEKDSIRFVIALGLRTLTLQTGDVYKDKIGLDETEFAVLIGSKSIKELHTENLLSKNEDEQAFSTELTGSESLSPLFEDEIIYDCEIPDTPLNIVIKGNKEQKLLYSPILICTIDHMVPAIETQKGGKWILPFLRIMSSDLVIDEVDDFTGKDLLVLSRLIHLAGMLGRKVLLSSATISPDIAQGFFNAYREGWSLFCKSRHASSLIGYACIDEFRTTIETYDSKNYDYEVFRNHHFSLMKKRVNSIQIFEKEYGIRRRGEILSINGLDTGEISIEKEQGADLATVFDSLIIDACRKHKNHHIIDISSQKKISFGLIRMATINNCIKVAEYFANVTWPEDLNLKMVCYHSHHIMLIRNEIEKHLDTVLHRSKQEGTSYHFTNPIIRQHIDSCSSKNVLFIVISTPIEEVGRDHDFDWAIVEPSSFRSIIQLAGRVRRHRNGKICTPNISILQYNLRTLKVGNDERSFYWPGYETKEMTLKTHNLFELVNTKHLKKSINAIPRILYKEPLQPLTKLSDLEHFELSKLLIHNTSIGPESINAWFSQSCWWLTALPQKLSLFRESESDIKLFLVFQEDELVFMEKDKKGNFIPIQMLYKISVTEKNVHWRNKQWIDLNYERLLENREDLMGESKYRTSIKFGEIRIPRRLLNNGLVYSDEFGLRECSKKEEILGKSN